PPYPHKRASAGGAPAPRDGLQRAHPLISAPRPAGSQAGDGLQRAHPLISAPRPAGSQPRDGLQRAHPLRSAGSLQWLPRRETLKITRVEAFHVGWGEGRTRSAWVRIWSDADIYGLGEASPMVHGNASLEI